MKRALGFILFMALSFNNVWAEIKTEEVRYQQGETTLNGYLAYDDAIEGKRPGILVVHEWWGHNAYVRKRAEMLAALGYIALAIDMYGEGKLATHPDTAGKFSSEVIKNMEGIGKARFLAALDVFKNHPMADSQRVAAIGYCFGGATVLQMARLGVDLSGVVSFHGSLSGPFLARPGQVKARVLVCNGADDSFVTPEQIASFKKEMEEAGVDYRFVNYEGAQHSFTNPQADELGRTFNLPLAYNAQADQQSWQDMQAFFNEIFHSREE